jgi:4-amino-4-deoxy-L-arabinose transferase-like glycosyltransferase
MLALVLSLLAGLVAYGVAGRVFERMPHIEDEIALVWQAQAIAQGDLTVPTPPHHRHFLVPFVVDYQGQRFGKYPLGWPALLSLGVRMGARALVNPAMAALAVWLTYRLGKRIFGSLVGLLAAALTLLSPFFWMNTGSLLSHPFGLVLSAAFALFWLDAFGSRSEHGARRSLAAATAGLVMGLLALTRPLTAVGLALPFSVHGLVLLARGDQAVRRRLLSLAALAAGLASLHFLWQYAVTGDPLQNPYTLWWPYDKLGFGPDVGRASGGHTLHQALLNTRFSLRAGVRDLFGWGRFSWLFLPFGLWALRRRREAWMIAGVFPAMVLVYLLYWVGAWVYGPRYYFEGLYSLTLVSAAGIAQLAGWVEKAGGARPSLRGWSRVRPLAVTALLGFLAAASLVFYNPIRLGGMYGLNGFNRARLQPFETAQARALAPALFIVHPEYWTSYGTLLELQDPRLTTPFLFTISRGPRTDGELRAYFSDRNVFHYDPDRPFVFLLSAPDDS